MHYIIKYSKCYLDDISSLSSCMLSGRLANCDSWDFDLANGNTWDCALFCTLIRYFLDGGGVDGNLTSIIKKKLCI